jgi:hypothetical protein
MRILQILLFSFAGGLALSGIVANLYRILARKPTGSTAAACHYAIMVVAGPSILFENATRSFRTKACSGASYGFAVAIAAYWALLLGMILVELAL